MIYFLSSFDSNPLDPESAGRIELFNLFLKKADICIDSTSRLVKCISNPLIKHLLKNSTSGGSRFIDLPEQFRNIRDDIKFAFVANPAPLYYIINHQFGNLDLYGIQISDKTNYIVSIEKLSSKPITLRIHFRNEFNQFNSWNEFLYNLPQRNSLIIADNYFLDKENRYSQNIFQILKDILPKKLSHQEFHISIITKRDLINPDRKYKLIRNFIDSLNLDYSVKLGLFLTETNKPHDRDIVSNYFRIKVGYSFDFLNETGRPIKDTEISLIPINSESSPQAHFGLLKVLADYTRDVEVIGSKENRLLDYFR